jgi:putative PIN family toxin of toxin-antitoxin system
MRAVVDANIWVSAVLNPTGPAGDVTAALMGRRFTLVISRPMVDELRNILRRDKVARRAGLTEDDIRATIRYLASIAVSVEVTGQGYAVCDDPDDNKVIETAVRGRASVIVSRDPHLCGEEMIEPLAKLGIRVLSVQEFLQALN